MKDQQIIRFLVQQIPAIPEITFHDLYEKYPDFNIDVENEKRLLADHQIIIWHHPFYWYSAPPLLKQWIDLVLEFGWAYGPGGNALEGKILFQLHHDWRTAISIQHRKGITGLP